MVIQGDYTRLLGSRAAQQMNLVTVRHENILQVSPTLEMPSGGLGLSQEQIMKDYGNVFEGLGFLPGE